MLMTPDTTKAMLMPGLWATTWDHAWVQGPHCHRGHAAVGSMLLPGTMVAQQQPGSGLISMACVTIGSSHKKHAC